VTVETVAGWGFAAMESTSKGHGAIGAVGEHKRKGMGLWEHTPERGRRKQIEKSNRYVHSLVVRSVNTQKK
jgi:hypothetical protein